jgi:hypothetical protein
MNVDDAAARYDVFHFGAAKARREIAQQCDLALRPCGEIGMSPF